MQRMHFETLNQWNNVDENAYGVVLGDEMDEMTAVDAENNEMVMVMMKMKMKMKWFQIYEYEALILIPDNQEVH